MPQKSLKATCRNTPIRGVSSRLGLHALLDGEFCFPRLVYWHAPTSDPLYIEVQQEDTLIPDFWKCHEVWKALPINQYESLSSKRTLHIPWPSFWDSKEIASIFYSGHLSGAAFWWNKNKETPPKNSWESTSAKNPSLLLRLEFVSWQQATEGTR